MTQPAAIQSNGTQRASQPGYIPRQFNARARTRFLKARRLEYLGQVSGEPTRAQIEMARSMAVLEWGALVAEGEGDLRALREAREHRRLLLRTMADFEKSLGPAPRASTTASALTGIGAGTGSDPIPAAPTEPELPGLTEIA